MKKYKVIYADPPWRFKNFSVKGEGRNAVSHYDCLTLPDLKRLIIKRHSDKDCALFMWVTDPMLDQGYIFFDKNLCLKLSIGTVDPFTLQYQ